MIPRRTVDLTIRLPILRGREASNGTLNHYYHLPLPPTAISFPSNDPALGPEVGDRSILGSFQRKILPHPPPSEAFSEPPKSANKPPPTVLRQAPAVGRQQTTAHCHSLTNSCWDTRRDVTRLWTFIPVAVSWLPTPPRPPPRRLHSRVGSHTGGRTGSWEEKWSTVADQTTTTTTPTNTISSTTTTTAPTTVPGSPPPPPPPTQPPPPKRTDPSRSAKSGHTEPVCTAASASPAVICEHPLFLSALRPPPPLPFRPPLRSGPHHHYHHHYHHRIPHMPPVRLLGRAQECRQQPIAYPARCALPVLGLRSLVGMQPPAL